jgi:hypothetical protein
MICTVMEAYEGPPVLAFLAGAAAHSISAAGMLYKFCARRTVITHITESLRASALGYLCHHRSALDSECVTGLSKYIPATIYINKVLKLAVQRKTICF